MTSQNKHHGWQLPAKETFLTYATGVTLLRTLLAVALALGGLYSQQLSYVSAALAVYWVGDILDGWIARKLHQEMRLGAVLDVVSDRFCVAVIYLVFASFHPDLLAGVGIYLFQFMVLDSVLSLAFLFWPLLSLNYFFLVDEKLYRLNWSIPAKVINSSLFIIVTMLFVNAWLSVLVAVLNTALKVYSLQRLTKVLQKK